MSNFFDSELVQKEMDDIAKLQEEVYKRVFEFPTMTKQDKLDHVEKLSSLLEKQQILYTRLKLSDDPEAKKMREEILKNATALGFSQDVDITYIFSNITKVLGQMKTAILDNP
jgi:predicted RNA binding protein with dsRBD fold (UPF0201 family)